MRRSSQDLWTQGEALERQGKSAEAIDLFVRAAAAEEDARHPLRAKVLWEQIGSKAGASGTLFERIASVCARGQLLEDAFDYWTAAAARYHKEGRANDAARAHAHALDFKKRLKGFDPERTSPQLARDAIEQGRDFVKDLLSAAQS